MLRQIAIFSAFLALSFAHQPFVVQYNWNYINYTWPSYEVYSAAEKDESYIVKNNVISGFKVWKDRIYLAIPRYGKGVPVTLAMIDLISSNSTRPLLTPYPNWEAQKIGDCSALQNVHNMEIDPKGRMWIVDSGRNNCPPKLVILDIENGGALLRSYTFPDNVVNYNTTVLKDIVIDHKRAGMAYISDSDEAYSGIVVYSLALNSSWKVRPTTMNFMVNDVNSTIGNVTLKMNTHGIALSPAYTDQGDKRQFYFSTLSSFYVFVVPTWVLVDARHAEAGKEREHFVNRHTTIVGHKLWQSEGMMMSNSGKLYFGMLADDGIAMWDSKANSFFTTGRELIVRERNLMRSPGSFAFDDKGQLWCMTAGLNVYQDDSLDVNRVNYRVMMSRENTRSYQYYEDGSAPDWPVI